MRIMQWGDSRKKTASAVIIILLCACINTACGNKDSEKNDEEAGYPEKESVSLRKGDDVAMKCEVPFLQRAGIKQRPFDLRVYLR